MTFKLPKFNLDPPEWKEVQRLRQAGLSEQADAVEAHFKSGDPLPKVGLYSDFQSSSVKINDTYVTYEELENHPQRHLVQWMIDTQQTGLLLGL